MLDVETRHRIDEARDVLVGKVPNPQSQVEQITIALMYKFMDDMDAAAETMGGKASFFSGEFEDFGWRKLFDPRLGGEAMLLLYSDAITKMSKNPNLPQLFRDIFKNAYLPYRDPETLKLFLKTIDGFNYDHSERLGDAFEYLLAVLGSQGDAGQFRTPRHIIDFMVQVVKPQKNESILDPACGTAGFLIAAYKAIVGDAANTQNNPGDLLSPGEKRSLMENIKGYDISPDMVRLSLVNLYLHGFAQPQIFEYDTLTSEARWHDYADVILANPPFMTPKGGIKPHKRFSVQCNRSEVLFVDYMAEHLTPQGRAAIIVPEGVIFQSANAYKQLRKYLVEQHYLWAVVSLPAGVFQPYSGVKTSILLLDRALAKKADTVLFVKVAADGFDLGAQRRPQAQNDLPHALLALQAYQQQLGAQAPLPQDGFFATNCLCVPKARLAQTGDYNLSADRYREQTSPLNRKWDMVALGDVAEIISGQSPEGEFYNDLGEGMPFYQGKTEFTEKYLDKPRKWTTHITKVAQKDDILMSVRAPVGPVNIATQEICIGRGLAAIRPDPSKLLLEFLFSYLRALEPQISGNSGAVFPSINRNDILNLQIPLPPLDVQVQIVAEIDACQRVIDGAQQVVQAWQPNLELALEEARHTANVDAWETVKLGDVCNIKGGKRLPKGRDFANTKTSHPYIRVSDFDNGSVNLQKIKFIDDEIFTSIKNYTISKRDIYISIAGTIGLFGIIPDELDGANLTENAAKISINSDDQIDKAYLAYIGNSKIIQDQVEKLTHAVGVPKLSLERIRTIVFPLPPLEIQQRIVAGIAAERQAVEACKTLITSQQAKIRQIIARVWAS